MAVASVEDAVPAPLARARRLGRAGRVLMRSPLAPLGADGGGGGSNAGQGRKEASPMHDAGDGAACGRAHKSAALTARANA